MIAPAEPPRCVACEHSVYVNDVVACEHVTRVVGQAAVAAGLAAAPRRVPAPCKLASLIRSGGPWPVGVWCLYASGQEAGVNLGKGETPAAMPV